MSKIPQTILLFSFYLVIGNFPICNGFVPGGSKLLVGMGMGYSYPYPSHRESTALDNYLKSKLKTENFTKLLLAENPDNSLTLEQLDTLEIPNFSEVTIKNNFVNMDVSFKKTTLSNFGTKVGPRCISVNLKESQISVGFSAYNLILSGDYTAQGSLLNGSMPLKSNGNWSTQLLMSCTFNSNFHYVNQSYIMLDTDADANIIDFRCDKAGDMYGWSGNVGCDAMRGIYFASIYPNDAESSGFDGIFSNIEKTNNVTGVKRYVEKMLRHEMEPLSAASVADRDGVIRTKFVPLFYKYVTNLAKEKSVFEMMNFSIMQHFFYPRQNTREMSPAATSTMDN
ncbi:uncharacterized protein LOC110842047 [Folsomia candida]|uniref:uncharacterized protein LOC110842047 n=1 Tax=Folsomia candida TaxID=158441 RepID=UPI001604E903|nr:uncharacterized protein LOC110842047 [Folsomia candida]